MRRSYDKDRNKTNIKKSFFKEKKIEVDNLEEFPTLLENNKTVKKENTMNYKSASILKEEEEIRELLEPGWIELRPDNVHLIKKRSNEVEKEVYVDELDKENYHAKAFSIFSDIVEKWKRQKQSNNNSIYGDDYHRRNNEYDSDNFDVSDDCEDDEETNVDEYSDDNYF